MKYPLTILAVLLLLSSLPARAQPAADSLRVWLQRRGYFPGSLPGASGRPAEPPYLVCRLNPDGSLTVSREAPLYYLSGAGQLLPGGPYEYGSESFTSSGYAIARRQGQAGVINRRGAAVIPFEYEALTWIGHPAGWLAARRAGRWGLVDSTGAAQVPFQYEEVEAYAGQLLAVKRAGRWGFVDVAGREVIAPTYDFVWQGFSEGFAAVGYDRPNGLGFINRRNQPITPFQYGFYLCSSTHNYRPEALDYYRFHQGFALVPNRRCELGVLDSAGREVLPRRFWRITRTDSTITGHRGRKQVVYRIPH